MNDIFSQIFPSIHPCRQRSIHPDSVRKSRNRSAGMTKLLQAFNPMRNTKRLNSLLSAILKQPVRVQKVLSRESQRIGCACPSERCFCYGADLMLLWPNVTLKLNSSASNWQNLKNGQDNLTPSVPSSALPQPLSPRYSFAAHMLHTAYKLHLSKHLLPRLILSKIAKPDPKDQ